MIVLLTGDGGINRTALNKLLYFSDAAALVDCGEKISKTDYVKLDYGPVPQDIDQTRSWLVDNEIIQSSTGLAGTYVQHIYRSNLDDASLRKIRGQFSVRQLEIIDAVRTNLGRLSATNLSAYSHQFEPWISGEWYETLNFKLCTKDQNLKKFLAERQILNHATSSLAASAAGRA